MTKKLLVFLACVGLTSQLVSCTSNESQSDTAVASDFDSADLEALDGESSATEGGDTSVAAGDGLPEDMLGESESTASTEDGLEETTDVASDDSLGADPLAAADTSSAQDVGQEIADVSEPAVDSMESASSDTTYSDSSNDSVFESSSSEVASSEPATTDSSTTYVDSGSSSSSSSYSSSSYSEPAPTNVPLQKMATTPWKQGGVWYNAVYFARPGDSLSKISKAIYGTDKTSMLKKGNPTFQSRGVKPGDKVYYNSPNRPDDSSRMLTYYEDNGITAETYAAQPGDNIRTISKKILGYDNAWKEVWASNLDVDSKGVLSEGAQLKYWSAGLSGAAAAPHTEVASAAPSTPEAPAPAPVEMAPPPMEDPMAQAQLDMPPPPPPPGDFDPGTMEGQGQEMAAADMPPPPPADMQEMAPPPPPMEMPETAATTEGVEGEEGGGLGEDQMMILGGLGVAVGALGFLMVRSKRKRREMEMHAMDNTHVGT